MGEHFNHPQEQTGQLKLILQRYQASRPPAVDTPAVGAETARPSADGNLLRATAAGLRSQAAYLGGCCS